jgi:ABC-2 type transport system ATP-binding protein
MSTLKVSGLTKVYKKIKAVDNINFESESGQVVGLIGHNGAGKTTILKCIMGLLPCKFDSIKIENYSIKAEFENAMQNIIFMPDSSIFYSYLTGFQNLSFYAKLYHKTKQDILDALDKVDLIKQMDNKVKTYSLGMKQRLSLARLICIQPKVVLMDEPFNGVDISGIYLIKKIVAQMRESGSAFLISSHNLHELCAVCDKLVLLKNGKNLGELDPKSDDIENVYLKKMNFV